jgi:TRAP-type C4-dicarboxylate transport system substrate-binding protein
LAVGSTAHADSVLLRMATPAPDGTIWAREIRAFARKVENDTHGQVRFKIYFGGVAGDELEVGERIRREQLDGAFAGQLCMRLAPSIRVMRVLGLFQSRGEVAYVLGRLKPTIDDEFRRAGYANLGLVGVGPELIFSRQPIHTLAELKAVKLWTWGIDNTLRPALSAMGFHVVAAKPDEAARLYDHRQIDAFVAAPTAALAFQWSAQAKYLLPLRLSALNACIIVADRAWDPLPVDARNAIRDTAAQVIAHLEQSGRDMDDELVGHLFAKQGMIITPVSPGLRAQFFDESRGVREKMGEQLVPRPLLDRVLSFLADYRAEHGTVEGD